MQATAVKPESTSKYVIHFVLAHSYIVYFLALIAGFILDLYFPYHFALPGTNALGYLFLLGGPALILWAQATSRKTAPIRHKHLGGETLDSVHFCVGPYIITRTPTNWGLFIMVLGLGLVLDSFSIVVLTLLAFLISRFIFITRQEALLEEHYGRAYREYQKHVSK